MNFEVASHLSNRAHDETTTNLRFCRDWLVNCETPVDALADLLVPKQPAEFPVEKDVEQLMHCTTNRRLQPQAKLHRSVFPACGL